MRIAITASSGPFPKQWRHAGSAFMLFFLLAFSLGLPSASLLAQSDPQPASAPTVDVSAISADEVNLIAREIWCPLCSGVRLDACELKACEQMKEMIAMKLAEGEDLEAIRTYFVAQYGPQVLGEPPMEGFNWLAWILPFVMLAIGGYVVWVTVHRMTRPTAAAVAAENRAAEAEIPDEYEAKLAEELNRYG